MGAGAGNLILTGANSFTGGLNLSTATTLLLGNNAALGTGTLTVGAASTLAANGATSFGLFNNLALNADVTLGQTTTNIGGLSVGAVNLGGGSPRTLTLNAPPTAPMSMLLSPVVRLSPA